MVKLNFLPHRLTENKKRQQRFYGWLGGFMTTGIVAVLAVGMTLDQQITQQSLLMQTLQMEHGKLDTELNDAKILHAKIIDLTQRRQELMRLRLRQNQTTQLLQTLADQTPSNVHLQTLKQQAARITLNGNAPAPADILQFVASLNRGMLTQVTLTDISTARPQSGSDIPGSTSHRFVITAEIMAPATNLAIHNSKAAQ
ncbi:PilN domain-containing protein [Herbaspirillum rhizosphaerae]|uniref:PilN domain-containing protein n=1 Tax=Herbaspirillum rhizosphaerae TaxID=346179 RepID=A0ABW8ZCT6_9BURK